MSSMLGNQGMRGSTGRNIGGSGLRGSGGNVSGYNRIPNFTPEMMQLFQSMFGDVGPESFLGRIASGDQEAFGQMEAPALRQFSELQGGLASRFSGMGMGGRHSSGFQNTANQAASNFAQDLQSKRMGLQSQAIKDLWGMKESLLSQKPYSYMEKPPGFLEQIFGGGGETLGNIAKIAALFI